MSDLEKIQKLFPLLGNFLPAIQLIVLAEAMDGEEKQFFNEMLSKLSNAVSVMPSTTQVQNENDHGAAVVHLHYFIGGANWWIIERDAGEKQLQAFGVADLGHGPEYGYISIDELIGLGVELDLYWKPKPISEIKGCECLLP